MNIRRRALSSPTRPLRVPRLFSKSLLVAVLAAALAFNVETVTSSAVFNALSNAVETVIGAGTVRTELARRGDALAAERDRLASDLDAQTRRGTALDQRIALLEAERIRLGTELDAQTRRGTALDQRIALLEVERIRLGTELEKAQAGRIVHYRGRQAPVREAVSDTAGRVATRVQSAALRNIASSFGEALPFFGVAVIAGATAWELADACALMKDMHALDVAFNPENAIESREVCGLQAPTAEEIWNVARDSPALAWEKAGTAVDGLPDWSVSAAYDRVLGWGARLFAGPLGQPDAQAVAE